MAIQADVLYEKSRESIIQYEDARFNSLISFIPDCYASQTDYTLWGSILRVVAQELARLEYCYSYDIVSLNPQYLTPPDIKRRYAAALEINKSFPADSQSDQDYKALLVALLKAYPDGTTVDAIEKVVLAYTGETGVVEELYQQIGNGIYDDSDRNTIKVQLSTQSVTPLSAPSPATLIQTLAQDLYAAIDLAKPAHVGLAYSLNFGSVENLAALIAAITDKLVLHFNGSEAAPLSPILTLAPDEDPTSPDTQLAAFGKLAGAYLATPITAVAYAGLMSDAFRAEYLLNADGTYSLDPARYNDILLLDGSGNPTGAVSQARGVLAPEENKAWEIKSDVVRIFRLT